MNMSENSQQLINLLDLPSRQIAEVHGLEAIDEDSRCRLLSLGIYPGVQIEILRTAPMGDPLQVRSGSTLISIRKREARQIMVALRQ